jgi:aryl-alcohol dehydrogenase-like predicted oxidoreductase
MIPFCVDSGVGLIPFSPLARGFLSGKRSPSDKKQAESKAPVTATAAAAAPAPAPTATGSATASVATAAAAPASAPTAAPATVRAGSDSVSDRVTICCFSTAGF